VKTDHAYRPGAVSIHGLTYAYGEETALRGVELAVAPYTTCAVIGPSGCGKTTLLYLIAGIYTPSAGRVLIGGETVTGVRLQTGLVLQDSGLLPWKSVRDNVALGLLARNTEPLQIALRVEAVLSELGVAAHADKYPDQLSGGQKQRVAIARTLVLEPDVLLLDEASSSLDAITKERIQDMILSIHRNRPMTMIIVTHSIEEAAMLGQRIAIMDNGMVKAVIDNDTFGLPDARLTHRFHAVCSDARRVLYDGGTSA
jgi:NitT/TauT family transport system ATP-binding protein